MCSSHAACRTRTRCGPSASPHTASRSSPAIPQEHPLPSPSPNASRAAPVYAEVSNMSKEVFELRLYVAGQTPKAVRAFSNLRKICDEHLSGRYSIEVIDLIDNPALGRGDQILALPTLVRRLPTPIKKIIGDLSNTERVLVGLDLRPRRASA